MDEWYEGDDQSYGDDFEDDDSQPSSKSLSQKSYTVLNKAEIERRQNVEISQISSVLSISRAEASVLLCHCNWKTSDLHDEWFANEQQLRTKAGLFTNNSQQSNSGYSSCGICFDDDLSADEVHSLGCGHVFCKTCWRGYIDNSINESGAGCLLLRCPQPKCLAAVGRDMVGELASEEAEKKYLHYFIRSYVEFKRMNVKWCPAPGCNNAIEIEPGCANNSYDVTCDCSHVFCYNCGEEPHRPVVCKIVREWILKNSSEAENTKWIMAYSKPCPKCKRPIEKNTGCNHMTCGAPCGHHFCWLCARTLGRPNYSCNCNGFISRDLKKINDEESQIEMAKQYLEKYAHYYERWASNNKSRDIALVDLNKTKSVKIHLLNDIFPSENLDFVIEAWEQIVECRRVLKWTYAYGFFLPEHEKGKQNLFNYLQGEAERALERLHGCAEKELDGFIDYEGQVNRDKFSVFRAKLRDLTKAAGNYFSNLVKGLENGLTEVWKESVSAAPATKGVEMQEVEYMEEEEEEEEFWTCDRCSYRNPDAAFTCDMCFEGL